MVVQVLTDDDVTLRSTGGDGSSVFQVEAGGTPAGTVVLEPAGWGNASVTCRGVPADRGAQVLRMVLEYAFTQDGFQVVFWWAPVGDWPARRSAWACGFELGPEIPAAAPVDGRRVAAWTGWIARDAPRSPRYEWFEMPELVSSRIRLRAWRDEEAERVVGGRTNPETAHFLPSHPQPYTLELARSWLDRSAEEAATGVRYTWCVADRETDLALASVTLFDLKGKPLLEGELGYWAHPDGRGRGYVGEAVGLVAEWFFRPSEHGGYGGRRLAIRTAATNDGSRKVAERTGFRLVGSQRQAYPLSGNQWDDRLLYELTAAEAQVASGSYGAR